MDEKGDAYGNEVRACRQDECKSITSAKVFERFDSLVVLAEDVDPGHSSGDCDVKDELAGGEEDGPYLPEGDVELFGRDVGRETGGDGEGHEDGGQEHGGERAEWEGEETEGIGACQSSW